MICINTSYACTTLEADTLVDEIELLTALNTYQVAVCLFELIFPGHQ
jgi:hypothetical protein